ncbi:hypothetical protein DEM27_27810 [Metarhizobium album]|uniref:Uncharacterized protein n=1 Tax=Metarhizobium album TaxID=2182425 RepID=A0A2U2DHZ8_9HYPH|nr:hypothetical protein DEM27_27810 [Rhizobium album]
MMRGLILAQVKGTLFQLIMAYFAFALGACNINLTVSLTMDIISALNAQYSSLIDPNLKITSLKALSSDPQN